MSRHTSHRGVSPGSYGKVTLHSYLLLYALSAAPLPQLPEEGAAPRLLPATKVPPAGGHVEVKAHLLPRFQPRVLLQGPAPLLPALLPPPPCSTCFLLTTSHLPGAMLRSRPTYCRGTSIRSRCKGPYALLPPGLRPARCQLPRSHLPGPGRGQDPPPAKVQAQDLTARSCRTPTCCRGERPEVLLHPNLRLYALPATEGPVQGPTAGSCCTHTPCCTPPPPRPPLLPAPNAWVCSSLSSTWSQRSGLLFPLLRLSTSPWQRVPGNKSLATSP